LTFLSKPKAQTPVDKLLHKTPVKMLREHPPVIVPRDRKVRDVLAYVSARFLSSKQGG
jgi:hypothetical protein